MKKDKPLDRSTGDRYSQNMPGIPPVETAARKEKLLEVLPLYGWSIPKAGIACGWSPKYAKTTLARTIQKDADLSKRILEKRRAIDAGSTDERDKALKKLDDIIADPLAHHRDVIRAVEVRGKMCGWMSETRIIETPQRQRELDEQNQKQARQLAILWGQTARLPGEAIDAEWQSRGQSSTDPSASQADGETYDDSA